METESMRSGAAKLNSTGRSDRGNKNMKKKARADTLNNPDKLGVLLRKPSKPLEESISNATAKLPKRYLTVLGCYFALFIAYLARVILSVAMIPMASEFGWSKKVQGSLMASFYYGYILTQVPAGLAANKYGGKVVLLAGVVGAALFTLAAPVAANAGVNFFIACRAATGVAAGLTFPTTHHLFAHWVLPVERSRAVAFVGSGTYLASGLSMLLAPLLIVSHGYSSVFFLTGMLGFIWAAIWHTIGYDTPEQHPCISPLELAQLRAGLNDHGHGHGMPSVASEGKLDELGPKVRTNSDPEIQRHKSQRVPWLFILSCRPVWALLAAHFSYSVSFCTILSWIPSYFHQAMGVPLSQVGYYSVFPFFVMAISANLGGIVADKLIARQYPLVSVRKIMTTVGMVGPAFFLAALCTLESAIAAVACMSVILALGSMTLAGYGVNHLDIGPKYAGVLEGLAGIFSTLGAIVGVSGAGVVLDATGSWHTVFCILAVIFLFGSCLYNMWASADNILD